MQNNDPAFHVGTNFRFATLREEHRCSVFENRMVGRIFEPNREEEVRKCKQMNAEERLNLFSAILGYDITIKEAYFWSEDLR